MTKSNNLDLLMGPHWDGIKLKVISVPRGPAREGDAGAPELMGPILLRGKKKMAANPRYMEALHRVRKNLFLLDKLNRNKIKSDDISMDALRRLYPFSILGKDNKKSPKNKLIRDGGFELSVRTHFGQESQVDKKKMLYLFLIPNLSTAHDNDSDNERYAKKRKGFKREFNQKKLDVAKLMKKAKIDYPRDRWVDMWIKLMEIMNYSAKLGTFRGTAKYNRDVLVKSAMSELMGLKTVSERDVNEAITRLMGLKKKIKPPRPKRPRRHKKKLKKADPLPAPQKRDPLKAQINVRVEPMPVPVQIIKDPPIIEVKKAADPPNPMPGLGLIFIKKFIINMTLAKVKFTLVFHMLFSSLAMLGHYKVITRHRIKTHVADLKPLCRFLWDKWKCSETNKNFDDVFDSVAKKGKKKVKKWAKVLEKEYTEKIKNPSDELNTLTIDESESLKKFVELKLVFGPYEEGIVDEVIKGEEKTAGARYKMAIKWYKKALTYLTKVKKYFDALGEPNICNTQVIFFGKFGTNLITTLSDTFEELKAAKIKGASKLRGDEKDLRLRRLIAQRREDLKDIFQRDDANSSRKKLFSIGDEVLEDFRSYALMFIFRHCNLSSIDQIPTIFDEKKE